ncbi:MAG: hypothetical protein LQ351_004534 [Letrouitia transgressa]|nr:MAG: hypothetical protein LQ351_004534 [Letrouitia transgressa]
MPQQYKKRGRREEKKRKREQEADNVDCKRKKFAGNEAQISSYGEERPNFAVDSYAQKTGETPFYGLLDDQEQEYFKKADNLLELNQFSDAEERDLFLANVYREASGKELKVACSQSCSRLMERLIVLSNTSQVKTLFRTFSGQFLHLAQHRFASHCCETLFSRAAPIVNEEMMASPEEQQQSMKNDEVYVSMENLFLHTLNELEGDLGYLMTDPFASHAIRVLLVVFSGRPMVDSGIVNVLRSKKNESIPLTAEKAAFLEAGKAPRIVPVSFQPALQRMASGIVAGLDTTDLRALACHPVANPLMQLLLELESLEFRKTKAHDENSLFRKLIPDVYPEEGTESGSFISGLLYDIVGSRLLEKLVLFAPGKTFKALYRNLLSHRLPNLAKNETASFVLTKVLERLSKDDLETAVSTVCPQLGLLIDRSRTGIIKTLVDRCRVREADISPIAAAFRQAYGPNTQELLTKLLRISTIGMDSVAADRKFLVGSHDADKAHGSLLVQSMLGAPDELRELVLDELLALETPVIIKIAKDRAASHALQMSLTCSGDTQKFRRAMIPRLLGNLSDLATDPVASHVVDSLWPGTEGLKFLKDKIAEELLLHETLLRQSLPGRAVWRNWKMDMYKTRRFDWTLEGRSKIDKSKTNIELARERFAASAAHPKAKSQFKSSHLRSRPSKNGHLLAGPG